MTLKSIFLFFFAIFFVSNKSNALELYEELTLKIEKVNSYKTRIIINRGTEDGIIPTDIANFYDKKSQSFQFKAVAIVAFPEKSEWVLFGMKNSTAVNEELEFKLVSLFGKKRPQIHNFSYFQETSSLKGQQFNKTKKNIGPKESKTIYSEREEKSIAQSNARLNANVTPLTYQWPLEELSYQAKIDFDTFDNKSYIFRNSLLVQKQEMADRFFKTKKTRSLLKLDNSLEFKDIWGRLSSLSTFGYQREKDSIVYPKHYLYQFGPLGLKKTVWGHKALKSYSMAYVPTFELFSGDEADIKSRNRTLIKKKKDSYLRHRFFIEIVLSPFPNIFIQNNLSFGPYHNIGRSYLDIEDLDLNNKFSINYQMKQYFSIGFSSHLSIDKKRKTYLNDDKTQWINGVTLNYRHNFFADIF